MAKGSTQGSDTFAHLVYLRMSRLMGKVSLFELSVNGDLNRKQNVGRKLAKNFQKTKRRDKT